MNTNLNYEAQDNFQNNLNSGNVSQCIKNNENITNVINTGFGLNNELHHTCKNHKINLPLYKDNYFSEFVTEEEKAQARHSLGLYNKKDIVTMSMLTTESEKPQRWNNIDLKQLKQGDKLFFPYTATKAVFNETGQNLDIQLQVLNSLIKQNQIDILSIQQVTDGNDINSLGDVVRFLQNFNNTQSLQEIIDTVKQESVSFETTGIINNS